MLCSYECMYRVAENARIPISNIAGFHVIAAMCTRCTSNVGDTIRKEREHVKVRMHTPLMQTCRLRSPTSIDLHVSSSVLMQAESWIAPVPHGYTQHHLILSLQLKAGL
eukprot:1161531-Pelagomonas_calceolata.AAC.2